MFISFLLYIYKLLEIMKSLKESFIKAKDLNNIGAKFDGTFKEGDIIFYADQYFYYYTEDEYISAELNIPTKKNFIRCDNSYASQIYILDPKRFDSNLIYNSGSAKISKIYRNTGKIKPLSKISDWSNYVKSKNLKNTINKSSYYILWDRSLQMNESFIKAKDLNKINHHRNSLNYILNHKELYKDSRFMIWPYASDNSIFEEELELIKNTYGHKFKVSPCTYRKYNMLMYEIGFLELNEFIKSIKKYNIKLLPKTKIFICNLTHDEIEKMMLDHYDEYLNEPEKCEEFKKLDIKL